VGEILRVRVINRHNRTHSFHAHLTNVPIEMDGSQANIIMDRGAGAMIRPGREYVYEFRPDTPGATYYHCHSADREFPINQHILQGLYGMIIVEDHRAPAVREEVLFMAETTRLHRGRVPPFIMNGMGVPGGELALEEIFKREGLPGVVAQLGKTVPFFNMKVGETMRLHVVNIGNQPHPLHIHEIPLISLGVLGGRPWPAQVAPLLSGAMDTLQIRFRHPGLWLFHCHVVSHADAGMIGVFVVE
jgi:FtsP/CotA-like multicopper oxidase with cupredoxin domain